MSRFSIAIFCAFIFTCSAFADYKLACWNINSRKGSKPTLVAIVNSGATMTKLKSVCLNQKDPILALYNYKTSDGSTSMINNKCTELVGAQTITSNHSPYKDHDEYSFLIGKAQNKKRLMGDYLARLILPKDLSPETLRTFRFSHRQKERLNGLMIIDPAFHSGQQGDNYISLFCQTSNKH